MNHHSIAAKPSWIIVTVLLFFSIIACTHNSVTYPDELAHVHENVIAVFLQEPVVDNEVQQILAMLNDKGEWSDIDYSSLQRGRWPLVQHLNNLQILSRAYRSEESSNYHKRSLSKSIHLSLNYWLDNDFQNPNWWNNEIGVPKTLAPVLFAMEAELTPEQMAKGLKILGRSEIRMAGQNKVWLSGNVLYKSLLLRHADSVKIASEAITNELRIDRLGIKTDMSYHEHGAMLQFGNYGLSYLGDMVMWMEVLNGTPYDFTPEKIALLRNYVLNGMQWVLWERGMDIAASGRHFFKGEQIIKRQRVEQYVSRLKVVDPEYAEAYDKAMKHTNLQGNKHFWNSDFQVHRTKDYYFSLKMSSNRVRGYETVNFENLQGYHNGSGMTLLYQTQKEYEDVFPFWNWKKLPGTTIVQDTMPIPISNAWSYDIADNFVGGVSDGDNGIAVLKYDRLGLKANKSWFMFDDKIVCLGAGITAKTNFPVTTSVNQTFLNGKIWTRTAHKTTLLTGEQEFVDLQALLHNDIGYLFPLQAAVNLKAQNVEGSWYDVAHRYPDVKEQANMFSLWIDHGTQPRNKNYAYVIVPNATEDVLNNLVDNPPFVYANTASQQSVISSDGKTAGIVFYTAGKSPLFGGVEVSAPCAIMLKKSADGLTISLSDPSYELTDLTLSITGNYAFANAIYKNGKTILTIDLPQGVEAGKTVNLRENYN